MRILLKSIPGFDKKYFFNILQNLNKRCIKDDFYDLDFDSVSKFKEFKDMIDLSLYDLTYIQNRMIIVKYKNTPIENISQIIISPFDTDYKDNIKECENIVYNYKPLRRNSYLTKPIKEEDRKKFVDEINQSDCIKGSMNPALLNAIVVYMLKQKYFNFSTMIVFPLKFNSGNWQDDDLLEYLQKYLTPNNDIDSIVLLNLTSNIKGQYIPQGYNQSEVAINMYDTSNEYVNNANTLLIDDLHKSNIRFNAKLCKDKLRNITLYDDLIYHMNIKTKIILRLFVFTDKKPTNKFTSFFLNDDFIVEYKEILNFMNLISRANY